MIVFLDPSFTLNTTVLLAVPVSESASNTHCMHSICELIADFKKRDFCHNGAFFWVTLRIKTILSMHMWGCRSTIKKRHVGGDGFCLVTAAAWHFWVIQAPCRKCIMRAEWRHEQCLWETPELGAIYSLTDEAGQGERATLECSGVCSWVVDGVREQERGSARESECIRMSVQWL